MNNLEKLEKLNGLLLAEMPEYAYFKDRFEKSEEGQYQLLRALSNVRPPQPISEEFLELQDEVLSKRVNDEGIETIEDLTPTNDERILMHHGDITQLAVDGIVNAANSALLGCFRPLHNCIDNAIHSKAGVQLRLDCEEIIKEQGHPEAVGTAKITPAYNLPSKYVLHTVGPQVPGQLGRKEMKELASCYEQILELADKNKLESLAFCCISTGVFGFPKEPAAKIAVTAVKDYLDNHPDTSLKKIVFNLFTDEDVRVYENLLL